jgi:hypothetical protein
VHLLRDDSLSMGLGSRYWADCTVHILIHLTCPDCTIFIRTLVGELFTNFAKCMQH